MTPEPRKDVLVTGWRNVYQVNDKPHRIAPVHHASKAHADAAAERVSRATGGAFVRVDVVKEMVDKGRVVEV
jgi:hypothetical protein